MEHGSASVSSCVRRRLWCGRLCYTSAASTSGLGTPSPTAAKRPSWPCSSSPRCTSSAATLSSASASTRVIELAWCGRSCSSASLCCPPATRWRQRGTTLLCYTLSTTKRTATTTMKTKDTMLLARRPPIQATMDLFRFFLS